MCQGGFHGQLLHVFLLGEFLCLSLDSLLLLLFNHVKLFHCSVSSVFLSHFIRSDLLAPRTSLFRVGVPPSPPPLRGPRRTHVTLGRETIKGTTLPLVFCILAREARRPADGKEARRRRKDDLFPLSRQMESCSYSLWLRVKGKNG